MQQIGFIINPIAGMGGSVGLAGTDGVLDEALARGAVPRSADRAREALAELLPVKDEIEILTCPNGMGRDLAVEMGFKVNVPEALNNEGSTQASDTIRAASLMAHPQDEADKIALLLFAGGDGTARDIYEGAGLDVPCIGIPAGVKIHSPVYARNPEAAGKLALKWLTGGTIRLAELEVLDIDEDEYRKEHINTRLFGYLSVPDDRSLMQNRKEPTPLSEAGAIAAIAAHVADYMEDNVFYVIGAGTTTRGVMEELGLPNTLIGVDLIRNRELVENGVYGERLLELIGDEPAKLVVTVTGGQGFLFGRGNQQLTPDVLRRIGKENIIIIASPAKLAELKGRAMLVDTGDAELDRELSGYYRVVSGYDNWTICKVER